MSNHIVLAEALALPRRKAHIQKLIWQKRNELLRDMLVVFPELFQESHDPPSSALRPFLIQDAARNLFELRVRRQLFQQVDDLGLCLYRLRHHADVLTPARTEGLIRFVHQRADHFLSELSQMVSVGISSCSPPLPPGSPPSSNL